MASPSSAAAVIVVGAGSVGANVAYRLARDGARVTVLDAGAPGSGASGASFAWTNSFGKEPRAYHDLNVAGMEEHERLAEELGGRGSTVRATWNGEEPGDTGRELSRTLARLREWDYPVETISPREAAALEPDLRFAPGVSEVVYAPRDGWVEVVPMIAALLAAAVRLGARVESGQRVTGFVREGDAIRGVVTTSGARFEGDLVVDCAGHAAGELAGLAGSALPVDGEPGRLIYTSPVVTTLSRPIHAPGVHFRPDGGGRIVLAERAHDQIVGQEPPGEWSPERSLAAVARHLPALAAARVEATRIGVRPMPRDRHPIIGGVPERPGLLRRRVAQRDHARPAVGPDRRRRDPRAPPRPAPRPVPRHPLRLRRLDNPMKLCQLWTPKDGARVGVVDGDRVIDITSRSAGVTSTLDLVVQGKTAAGIDRLAKRLARGRRPALALADLDTEPAPRRAHLRPPIDAPEIWARASPIGAARTTTPSIRGARRASTTMSTSRSGPSCSSRRRCRGRWGRTTRSACGATPR